MVPDEQEIDCDIFKQFSNDVYPWGLLSVIHEKK